MSIIATTSVKHYMSNSKYAYSKAHPSIWKLINGLRIADYRGRKKLVEYDRGDDFDQRAI